MAALTKVAPGSGPAPEDQPRGIWRIVAIDIVFLMLAMILLCARGFERGVGMLRMRLPTVSGRHETLVSLERVFLVRLGRAGPVTAEGKVLTMDEIDELGRAARDRGDDVAGIAVIEADVAAELLLETASRMGSAGFQTIGFVLQEVKR